MTAPLLMVGGLGRPHDDLAAAALRSLGHEAVTLGALDDVAAERGRAVLPRGQCAPALYTTGALLRTVEERRGRPLAYLSAHSCGPCRYSMFEPGWKRALAMAGLPSITFETLVPAFGRAPSGARHGELLRVVDALLVADVLAESARRLRPHVEDAAELDRGWGAVLNRVVGRVEVAAQPVQALLPERGWHRTLKLRAPTPLARAVIIGDPWSLHVEGDGQMNLPSVLAAAGVESEVPPLALWMNYLLWQVRQPAWSPGPGPSAAEKDLAASLEGYIERTLVEVTASMEMDPLDLPMMDELAELAAPFLPSTMRGGYGHVEVALAVRAVREHRAHVVFSVKSFGCLPSGAVSDEIVPTALGGALPFLAVEVCGDGQAARESRLMLRVAAALEKAEDEFRRARASRGGTTPPAPDPLWTGMNRGRRAYACTLASLLDQTNQRWLERPCP